MERRISELVRVFPLRSTVAQLEELAGQVSLPKRDVEQDPALQGRNCEGTFGETGVIAEVAKDNFQIRAPCSHHRRM